MIQLEKCVKHVSLGMWSEQATARVKIFVLLQFVFNFKSIYNHTSQETMNYVRFNLILLFFSLEMDRQVGTSLWECFTFHANSCRCDHQCLGRSLLIKTLSPIFSKDKTDIIKAMLAFYIQKLSDALRVLDAHMKANFNDHKNKVHKVRVPHLPLTIPKLKETEQIQIQALNFQDLLGKPIC